MRSGGGKQKGSQFEREICKKLSLWVSNNRQEDVFWRSAMSGGRSTVAWSKGVKLGNQVGDISSISPLGTTFTSMFVAECKFYSDLNILGLLTGTGNLIKFWAEVRRQGKLHNKMPFLIAKQNRLPVFLCLNLGAVLVFSLKGNHLLHAPKYNLYLYDFDKFLKEVQPP